MAISFQLACSHRPTVALSHRSNTSASILASRKPGLTGSSLTQRLHVRRIPPPRSSRRSTLQCVAASKVKFSSFEDMVSQSDVVLVDFYAKWCGPCQMMAQILEEAKRNVGKDVTFVKIDTEKYPKLAGQYNVQALPTLVLFRKGKMVSRIEGVLNADDLRRWIGQSLQKMAAK